MPTDCIIPLGTGSASDNDELRILLRSLEKNAEGVGRVVVVSQCAPSWLSSAVELIDFPDRHGNNKDANIIEKTLAGIRHLGCNRFVSLLDDFVFLQRIPLDAIPILYNNRGQQNFAPDFRTREWGIWHKRIYHTFWLADMLRLPISHNYECHAPQSFDATKILAGIKRINYQAAPGFGIYTLFRLLEGITGGEDQRKYKRTFESASEANLPFDLPLGGYNDDAFLHGLRERLFALFPEKSRFET